MPVKDFYRMRTYWKVALLGWQDSLIYRFNALVWVFYAVVPSITLMLVWLAAYENKSVISLNGFNLSQMLTYYLFITALSVAITPHPEWEIATTIRDGKMTPYLVRPISYFGYRLAWESSYQIIKTAMMLPAFGIIWWFFRDYIALPAFDLTRFLLFVLATLNAYLLLTHIKFLLGISAFWILEPGGLMEIYNVINGLFSGKLLPMALLPIWAQWVGNVLPFAIVYAFPMDILLDKAAPETLVWGFARQIVWLGILSATVNLTWKKGLLRYEAVGS
jgi:ABC-2 type transport system permease protein